VRDCDCDCALSAHSPPIFTLTSPYLHSLHPMSTRSTRLSLYHHPFRPVFILSTLCPPYHHPFHIYHIYSPFHTHPIWLFALSSFSPPYVHPIIPPFIYITYIPPFTHITISYIYSLLSTLCLTQWSHGEVGGWGRDPKKCTERDWGMGSSTI